MSGRAFAVDGLWLALCPSFKQLPLSHRTTLVRSRQRIHNQGPPATAIAPTQFRRCYSENAGPIDTPSHQQRANSRTPRDEASDSTPDESDSSTPNCGPYFVQGKDPTDPERWVRVRPYPQVPESIRLKSTPVLESLLRKFTSKDPNMRNSSQVLRALIRDRRTEPRTRHYQALILANCDSTMGSSVVVRNLLQEMEDHGITADSGTLHAALKAVAVHPDYVLRQEILRKLRDRWLTVSPDGWHFMVAGLLREHQFELALDHISSMELKGNQIEPWLHSMAVYLLCDFGELDEVYRLMQNRVEQGHDMTLELWSHVLNAATKARHSELTRYVWRREVELGYLDPSRDACSHSLAVASDAGDIELALSIFRFCEYKGYTLGREEHEQVLAIHLQAGDLPAVFSLLCSMHEVGLRIVESSIQAIVSHMIERRTDPREAWQILKRLKHDRREVPLKCPQIIAEVCEHRAKDDPLVVADAIGFYKELYTVCPEGADVKIYNALMRMCRRGNDRQSALFLVKEMSSFNIIPDSRTFEALVFLCLDARNYKSAFKYLRDLLDRDDWTLSSATRSEIRSICAQSVNEFAVLLQHHPAVQEVNQVGVYDQTEKDSHALEQRTLRHRQKRPQRRYGRTWYRAAYRRQMLPAAARIAWNKKRRQRNRLRAALARKDAKASSLTRPDETTAPQEGKKD